MRNPKIAVISHRRRVLSNKIQGRNLKVEMGWHKKYSRLRDISEDPVDSLPIADFLDWGQFIYHLADPQDSI
jgi:hypothetical protein